LRSKPKLKESIASSLRNDASPTSTHQYTNRSTLQASKVRSTQLSRLSELPTFDMSNQSPIYLSFERHAPHFWPTLGTQHQVSKAYVSAQSPQRYVSGAGIDVQLNVFSGTPSTAGNSQTYHARFFGSSPNETPASSIQISKARKKKAPNLTAKAWEPYKARVIELHISQGVPLPRVKEIMEEEAGFEAT
jgi:Clr5 domain